MYGIINIAGKQCSCSSFHLIGHVLGFHWQILSQGTALNSKTDHHKKVVTFSLFLIWIVIRCNAFKIASNVVFCGEGSWLAKIRSILSQWKLVLVGELSEFSWSDWRFQKKNNRWSIVYRVFVFLGRGGGLTGLCKSSHYFVIGRICNRLKPLFTRRLAVLEVTTRARRDLRGVYMTPGRLSPRGEFTPVPSHGSIFVYMIPPQNVMPARVTPAWVHPGSRTGARISLRYEISQRYHVNAKRPPISVWNRSAGRLERVAHA